MSDLKIYVGWKFFKHLVSDGHVKNLECEKFLDHKFVVMRNEGRESEKKK